VAVGATVLLIGSHSTNSAGEVKDKRLLVQLEGRPARSIDLERCERTCRSIRRCSVCNERGHDRRNCPRTSARPRPANPAPGRLTTPTESAVVAELASSALPVLIHLYWPARTKYFEQARDAYVEGSARWWFRWRSSRELRTVSCEQAPVPATHDSK
jgi:hypothetical protein